jgi:PTH1 family peptidyl-tRNA hydrolase
MKLIVGLGNPGPKYRGTLHNVGFDVVDMLAARHGVTWESAPADALIAKIRNFGENGMLLAKPLTWMNLSGRAVGDLARYFKIDPVDVLIVVDDVNLPSGQLRARRSGSAGGHNGLKSIIELLGTDQFPRLRVGVGRGDPRRDLADHVLGRVGSEEKEILAEATALAAEAAELFVTQGIEDVMNRYNRRKTADSENDAEAGANAKDQTSS